MTITTLGGDDTGSDLYNENMYGDVEEDDDDYWYLCWRRRRGSGGVGVMVVVVLW